jgi:hypothetical protein
VRQPDTARAEQAAREARVQVGAGPRPTESDVRAMVAAAGARLRFYPHVDDLPGLLCNRSIWVSVGLPPASRRWVIAHELGHPRLGHGNALRQSAEETAATEAEADAFAESLMGTRRPRFLDRYRDRPT